MTETAEKAAPGWYADERWPGEQRRWDGVRWLDHWRPLPSKRSASPEGFMWAGFILGALGGMGAVISSAVSESAAWIVLWVTVVVAGLVFNIGAVAKAVEVGIRASRR